MTTQPRRPLRMLMLATDAHGGFGGIAQYNRDVLDALSTLDQVARVVVVPRLVADAPIMAAEAFRPLWEVADEIDLVAPEDAPPEPVRAL